MNLPNKITMARIVLIPVFLILCYAPFAGSQLAALAVFVLASVSDFFDGYLARKYKLITDFGKFLDPIADKMLVMAALCMFVAWNRVPAWVLLVILVREFAVSALRMVAADGGKVIAAAWSGKVKTASTMVCIILMLLVGGLHMDTAVLDVVCSAVMLVTTVYSGVEYFVKNKDVVNWADM